MTDTRETVEPSREAKAHCIMQLSKVTVRPREEETKNYFRVGEVLALADEEKASVAYPLEFKVKEVNDNGDIIDLEIVNHGEYDGEIFETADLQYKDMDSWLDIDSNFGLVSDLRIDREEEGERRITVKDYTGNTDEHDELLTDWFDINKIWDINSLPDEAFGVIGDAYIRDENAVFFKTPEWLERNHVYVYENWKMPINYGNEGTVVYNVFGDTWLKTHCGWYKSPHYINLGEIGDIELDPAHYHMYDIIEYKRQGTTHKVYKCCSKCFSNVLLELDWEEMPTDDFGENLDMFIYPEGNYRVKIAGHWMISPTQYRFDQLYLEDDWVMFTM
jgi:hypothetical protein